MPESTGVARGFSTPVVDQNEVDRFFESKETKDSSAVSDVMNEFGLTEIASKANSDISNFMLDSNEINLIKWCKRLLNQITILRQSSSWRSLSPPQRAFLIGAQTAMYQVLCERPPKGTNAYGTLKELLGDTFPVKLLGMFGDTNKVSMLKSLDQHKIAEVLGLVD